MPLFYHSPRASLWVLPLKILLLSFLLKIDPKINDNMSAMSSGREFNSITFSHQYIKVKVSDKCIHFSRNRLNVKTNCQLIRKGFLSTYMVICIVRNYKMYGKIVVLAYICHISLMLAKFRCTYIYFTVEHSLHSILQTVKNRINIFYFTN